jgi:hypothetical protein
MAAPKTAPVDGRTDGDGRHDDHAEQARRRSKSRSRLRSRSDSRRRRKPDHAQPKLSAAESRRINGRKSKGPITEAGKARSRYNALKHGMTAQSLFLSGEDPAEFEARLAELNAQFQPRNELEAELLKRLARDWWFANRAQNAAAMRLEYRIHHQPHEEARALEQQVAKLGRYLLKDAFRPAGSLRSEKEGGARHPALLVIELEATLTGCDWLLSQLERLQERIRSVGTWLENDGFTLVRLLGKYRGELIGDDRVATVLLDSRCLTEKSLDQAERDEQRRMAQQLGRAQSVVDETLHLMPDRPGIGPSMRFARLYPEDVDHARQRLTQVINEHSERIKRIRAVHSEIMAADAVRAAERLTYDPSPEGDRERRYTLAHERRFNQTIATFVKVRASASNGTVGETGSCVGRAVEVAAPAEASAAAPSLALRAGMERPAPAEDEPTDTSPKGKRGSCEMACANGAQKVPFIGAHTASQTPEQPTSCGETNFFSKRPGRARRLRSVQARLRTPVGGSCRSGFPPRRGLNVSAAPRDRAERHRRDFLVPINRAVARGFPCRSRSIEAPWPIRFTLASLAYTNLVAADNDCHGAARLVHIGSHPMQSISTPELLASMASMASMARMACMACMACMPMG